MADKTFDQYEYVAIIVPGATLLLALTIKWPQYLHDVISEKSLSLGDLGIFLLLAYIAGQFIQSVAEVADRVFWRVFFRGLPTDWVLHGGLLQPAQITELQTRVRTMIEDPNFTLNDTVPVDRWRSITRQVYAKVSAAGRAARVDAFNRTFGLMRGFVVALFAVGITFLVVDCRRLYGYAILAFILGLLALLRLYLFGRDYGRELFVQYVELPAQQQNPQQQNQPQQHQPNPI
jgi:hypothetical protein